MARFSPALIRRLALVSLVPMALLATAVLTRPEAMTLLSHGPIQKGHTEVACSGCHEDSVGTIRQQTQANLRHLVGLRSTPADFGFAPVTSEQCVACHERPNDRHPIYRFREPRFSEAIAQVEATSCLGCHTEHTPTGRDRTDILHRLSQGSGTEIRSGCPHVTLIAEDRWGTCMGCHDFHGNHARKAQTTLALAYDPDDIRAYLQQAPGPYGTDKSYPAKTSPDVSYEANLQ